MKFSPALAAYYAWLSDGFVTVWEISRNPVLPHIRLKRCAFAWLKLLRAEIRALARLLIVFVFDENES